VGTCRDGRAQRVEFADKTTVTQFPLIVRSRRGLSLDGLPLGELHRLRELLPPGQCPDDEADKAR
jgi:hypothetical protein